MGLAPEFRVHQPSNHQASIRSFSVPCKTDLNEKHPDGISMYNFKHESWNQFIRAMDDELVTNYFEVHQEYPRFGIVWLGTDIMPVF